MSATTRTEVRKLRHTRSLWALPAVGFTISAAATLVLMGWMPADELPARLHEHGSLRFGATNLGLAVLLFAIRVLGDELHHGTLAATFLAQPDRKRVLAAKAIVAVATAVVLCVAVDVAVLAITAIAVAQRDLSMDVDVSATAALLGRATSAMALLALLGVAIGGAVRNRTAALVGCVVALTLGETIVGGLVKAPEVMPSAAVHGLVTGGAGADVLAPFAAAAVLAAYVAAAGVAALIALRRDIV